MSDKKHVVTPENCGKNGKITTAGKGGQITYLRYWCGDKVNCKKCRYIFNRTEGRLTAIEQAISDGAFVYVVNPADWKTVRTAADRSGNNKDYIKFIHQGVIYFITHAPAHAKSRVINPANVNFDKILAEVTDKTYFKGKYDRYIYAENKNRRDRRKKDTFYYTYFPILRNRSTKKIVSPDNLPPVYLAHMCINSKFGTITSENVQEFMIWRAEAVASIALLNDARLELYAFYEEKKKEVKADLDAGQAVTNRRIPESFLDGPELDSAQASLIDAITFGEHPPLYKLKDYPIVRGKWNAGEDIETTFEQKLDTFEDYGLEIDDLVFGEVIQ